MTRRRTFVSSFSLLHYLTRALHSVIDWTKKDEDGKDLNVWKDNWDDDNVEDDFSVQLRYSSLKIMMPFWIEY